MIVYTKIYVPPRDLGIMVGIMEENWEAANA